MTNKLVVIINSLKVPKIKKTLLYEMKFLVPNYSCLQIRGLPPPDPRSLCPLSSTEFVDPPRKKKFLGTPLASMITWLKHSGFLFRGPFSAVYVVAVNGEVEPKQMLEYWREIIRYTPGTFECVQKSWMRYAARRVNTQGQHFEHFVICCRLVVTPLTPYITFEWAFRK